MKAVLEIGTNDLNIHLVEVLNSLFQQNVTEVLIRRGINKLEEFDTTLKLDDIMASIKASGHNELLLKDIEQGFKNSTIFSEQ